MAMDKEQIAKIRKSILDQIESQDMPEENKSDLREQIKNASDEEIIDFVKQRAPSSEAEGTECIFCSIAEGKIQTFKVLENSEIIAFLDINPANVGHILIIPKKHFQFLFQLPQKTFQELFSAVNKLMPILINVTKAEGASIYIAQGIGQHLKHLAVNLIPRFKEDKIAFEWERKKANQDELKNLSHEISARVGKDEKEEKEQKIETEKRKTREEEDIEKIMKQLRRRT